MEFIYTDCLLYKVAKENRGEKKCRLFILEFPANFDFQIAVWYACITRYLNTHRTCKNPNATKLYKMGNPLINPSAGCQQVWMWSGIG